MNNGFVKIPGYHNHLVNPNGVVKSIDRIIQMVNKGTLCSKLIKGKELKSNLAKGYLRFTLCGENRRCVCLHRIMAITFISNPENKPEVNHKDGDKMNNSIGNLEWVTKSENIQHAWDNNLFDRNKMAIQARLRIGKKAARAKMISQISDNGAILKTWDTVRQASKELNVCHIRLCKAARNNENVFGFKWQYPSIINSIK